MAKQPKDRHNWNRGAGGGIWFLGFIGALVYYWSGINSFWEFWVVLFKSVFWPAYFIYHMYQFLQM